MYSRVLCKLVLNDILMSFLHCKALRTAMYKRYINAIIITQRLFSVNYLFGEQILPRIFFCLRTARNFSMIVLIQVQFSRRVLYDF